METSEQQEARSRESLDLGAVFKTAFAAGLVFFYMSGGSPWSTAGTMNMIMGRDIPVPHGWMGTTILAIGHFAVALVYMWIIAALTYRLKTPIAVAAGVLIGVALYGVNIVVFRSSGLLMQSPEFVTFFVHVVFAFFASLMYKAMSVKPPLES